MSHKEKPGAGVSAPPGPRRPEYINAEPYSGESPASLGVDHPLVWNAVVIELPGATEPVFNLMLDTSALRHERRAFVRHHFESTNLPAPDNIVVLHKARDTMESDCLMLARQMGASVVMINYASKRLAWAYPVSEDGVVQ